MRAFVLLVCIMSTACAAYPPGRMTDEGTRVVLGRINDMPRVNLWGGHVSDNDVPIYEIALAGSRERLVGIIPGSEVQCPYNGRPREQLFRIEYGISNQWISYREGPLPRHLATRNIVTRCDLVTSGDAGA